jgi:hypothetical protein
MGDPFSLPQRRGAFLQQGRFELAAPVLFPADADNENGMADGKPQKDDEQQDSPENKVLFKHGHALRGCNCFAVCAGGCLVSP